jgi:hypothetical protein
MGGRSTPPHSSTIGGRTTGDARITPGRSPRTTPLELAARYLTGDADVRARVDAEVAAMRAEPGELRGDELIGLGVPGGPAVGAVLGEIRARRRRGEIANRAAEIDYVRAWVSERHTDDEREG